jgi:hypothetical protein
MIASLLLIFMNNFVKEGETILIGVIHLLKRSRIFIGNVRAIFGAISRDLQNFCEAYSDENFLCNLFRELAAMQISAGQPLGLN